MFQSNKFAKSNALRVFLIQSLCLDGVSMSRKVQDKAKVVVRSGQTS